MPTLPSASSTLTAVAAWSQPVFDGFLPYAELAVGVLLAIGLIWFLVNLGGHLLGHMKGK